MSVDSFKIKCLSCKQSLNLIQSFRSFCFPYNECPLASLSLITLSVDNMLDKDNVEMTQYLCVGGICEFLYLIV